jgi:hypothetical protein
LEQSTVHCGRDIQNPWRVSDLLHMLSTRGERSEVPVEGHPDEQRLLGIGSQLGADAATLVRRVRTLKWLALMRSAEAVPALDEHLYATEAQLQAAETHFYWLKEALEEDLRYAGQMKQLCRRVREQRQQWRRLQVALQQRRRAGRTCAGTEDASPPSAQQPPGSEGAPTGRVNDSVSPVPRKRDSFPRAAPAVDAAPRVEPVTEETLQQVPGHIRGRVTIERLHRAISDIESILRYKYALLRRPKHELTSAQLDQRCRYEDMETDETRGHYFFSETDIKSFASLKQDTTGRALMNVFRHLGRLRESRAATHARIWILSGP